MKARIIKGTDFGRLYADDYQELNGDLIINGVLVSEWVFTDVLPNPDFIKPTWNGTAWSEGATTEEINGHNRSLVPKCISRRQFFTQLFIEGINEQDIIDVINQLPPIDNSLALIAFREAATFERNSPLLVVVGQMLGLTDSDIDTIFTNASQL